ncbi:hypothetical protein H4219_005743 [Mycoemilia scoparia]|uniref:CCHC-type domain-containing protein n=1 Tax=Mycoemilia scoparia TaxID=417184 RepID=A0A9W7ZUU4_9FUNG|nr:hypothetical protein H4219_005743 [Mycoemilia scoparia]
MTRVAKPVKKQFLEASEFKGGKSLIPTKSEVTGKKKIKKPNLKGSGGDGKAAENDETKNMTKEEKWEHEVKRLNKIVEKYHGEKRRLARVQLRELEKTCFHCREKGHSVKNCPQAKSQGIGICYHCGSEDHTTKSCTAKSKKFAFATCFVCNQQGHITSQCKKNENGLYPDGGGCKYCGSVNHYARQCKPNTKQFLNSVGTIEADQGGDDDDVYVTLHRIQKDKKRAHQLQQQNKKGASGQPQKKKKVVTI